MQTESGDMNISTPAAVRVAQCSQQNPDISMLTYHCSTCAPQMKEYIDWQWPCTSLHTFHHDGVFGPGMVWYGMIWYFQLVGVGVHALPLSLYLPPRLELRCPLHPLHRKTSERMLPQLSHVTPLLFSLILSAGPLCLSLQ